MQYDVVVLGSGAAGLTAALAAAVDGARVLLLEKGERIGGTTALSGAGIWIPASREAAEAGVEDSTEVALDYLLSLSNDLIDPDLARALIERGPDFLDFLREHTELRYQLVPGFPDYHPEQPGAFPEGGRALDAGFFSFAGFEDWRDRIVGEPRRIGIFEMPLMGGTGRVAPDVLAEREAQQLEGLGRALIGGLLKAALARGVEVETNARGTRLVTAGGAVTGVKVESPDGARVVRADAVILATGGFEYDRELVRSFLRGPLAVPIGVPTNTGDGLRMAMRVGAGLGNMREAWWTAVIVLPGERPDGGGNGLLSARERSLPGSIIVNARGRRIGNEAANYNAFGAVFHVIDESTLTYPNEPAYLVFSQSAVDRFGLLGGAPGDPIPDWVTRADTPEALAEALGIDVAGFTAQLARFNAEAREGRDPDFHRGRSAFDRFPGGRTVDPGSPFATLGPLEQAPYYGVEIASSALGTKGGPRTDAAGRVLDVDGSPIPGLYAAGNAMASPTGMVYGGAGATIAVAGVFGMLAGRAAVADRRD